ncbi:MULTISPECIES: DUF4870 domain-containing protein [Bacillaceae]|uniref:DUF4870 domain-containing protein n=1 Tax=Bacillaceae TaxID=186817 RepID=UPI0006211300|nr:DUF4870 domain-containing protein [Oceanobacillus caeni]KKE78836.1 hypothetical protein WH51_10525 [Bacilli bacterium VT-13-104]
MIEENKLLSALCYWSIFFAPILFPILVWIFGNETTKLHAKKALWTHIIPAIASLIAILVLGTLGLGLSEPTGAFFIATIIAVVICFLIDIYYFIWNIIKGIKVITY